MARLQILSNEDFKQLYTPPILTDEDRKFVFTLDEKDKIYLETLKNIPAKIHYILNMGYFRISQYFFSLTFQKAREDVKFIINTYFPNAPFPTKNISQHQYYSNRQAILKQNDMNLYSKNFEKGLKKYLKEIVKQHTLPKYLFDCAIEYCHQNRIVRPAYSTLQKLISTAYNNEKLRISNKFYGLMDDSLRQSLNKLLKKNDLFYQFTLIKRDQKDFSTTEIKATIEKNKLLSEIYTRSLDIIKKLDISNQNVDYYAELAEQYTVPRLRILKPNNLARIYLLCYVHYRFLKINDHLITSFAHRVNGYIDDADSYQKEAIYNAKVTDQDNRSKAAKILSIHINKKIADHDVRKKSFKITPEKDFKSLIQKIKKPHFAPNYYRWQFYKKKSHAIKCNIRSIFKTIDFESKCPDLKKAITFLKSHFQSEKSFQKYKFEDVPVDFIPASLKRYVITKIASSNCKKKRKSIDGNAYEFILYLYIEKSIPKGTVTIKDSLSYKALEDELLSKSYWELNKNKILESIKNQIVTINFKELLEKLESLLTSRYKEVNDKINSGVNNKIKIKSNKKGDIIRWNIPYKRMDDSVNNPYYDSMNIISLSQIIKFTNHHSEFMKGFTHILPSYGKIKPSASAISACIVAKATGNDIYKMKDISDVDENTLISTYDNFIRRSTLITSSDITINELSSFPIFKEYTLAEYGVHSSIDGQKLETRYNTIKSRYSAKYYGLGKGVSAYTLFANCLPLATKIIGANEHESHYLLDALRSNSSNVKISAVSSDMHGINRVNFILLYMFGYRFMPRFTQLDKKTKNHLISFDTPEKYKDCIMKPVKKVNKALILKEADNILRILATLALKQNTQSNIVRKLSSNTTNDTMKALIELDKIIMSLYMLDYVDDENMRQCVHRSLNRGESYHQLRAAISKISGKKLIGKSDIELDINNECARLLAICIIFYNAYLLSKIYTHCKNQNLKEECQKIIRLSPIAWQHINFVGKYEFTKNVELPNIDSTLEQLIQNLDQVVLIVDSKSSSKMKVIT